MHNCCCSYLKIRKVPWKSVVGADITDTRGLGLGSQLPSTPLTGTITAARFPQQSCTQSLLAARLQSHHPDYRAGMAISTTTRKVILDGELIQSPSHRRLLTLLCSGTIHSFSGASPPMQMANLSTAPQAAAWYTVQVSFAVPFVVIFRVRWYFQWLLSSYGPEGSKEVGAKPLEALKRLGHEKLKLNEYESAFALSRSDPQVLYIFIERIASEVIHPDDIDVGFTGMFRANVHSCSKPVRQTSAVSKTSYLHYKNPSSYPFCIPVSFVHHPPS